MDQETRAAAPPSSPLPGQSPPKFTNRLRRAGRVLGLCLLACVLALSVVVAGSLVALRSESVQGWLTDKINTAMQAAPQGEAAPAIRARITHLSGPLPFAFALGVELYDADGLWLRLPACSARWDWQALPGALRLAFVRVDSAELLRLPTLPQAATVPPPAPPLTEAGLRASLADAQRALGALPGWLPKQKLNLGLDLQGGSYLLLEVDTQALRDQHDTGDDDRYLGRHLWASPI